MYSVNYIKDEELGMSTQKTKNAKGNALENYVADRIRDKGIDPKARRSIGSGSGTREKADIDTTMQILGINIGIECKNQSVAKVREWWSQAQELEYVRRVPVVVYKLKGENFEDSKVIISLDTFLDMAKRSQAPMIERRDDSEFRWLLQTMVKTCNKLIKYAK